MKSKPEIDKASTAPTVKALNVKNQAFKQGINMPDSKALTVAGTAVRQMNGLYSLNDLHKAAGGEAKHRPSYFIQTEQAQALIAEIAIAGIPAIEAKPRVGSYACPELVVAYAAWISATFHLKVIRVFLKVAAPQSVPYSVQPGQSLSGEQAATLRNMLNDWAKKLSKAEQGNAMVVGWSKLKAHFKTSSYRQIPAAEFHEAVNILARHIADWQVQSFEPSRRSRDLERANKGLP